MELNKLSSIDLDNFNKLLRLSSAIYRKYKILYKLELSGKKDTKDYFDVANTIYEYSCIEEQLIEKYFSNEIKNELFIIHIADNYFMRDEDVFWSLIDKDNKVIKRVLNSLTKNIDIEKDVEKNFKEQLSNIGIIDIDDDAIEIDKMVFMEHDYAFVLEEEILGYFLNNIDELISKQKYQRIKSKLLKIKYDVSFMNKTMEPIFLDLYFKSVSGKIFSENMIKYKYDLSETDTNLIREEYFYGTVKGYIGELLDISNDSPDNKYRLLLLELYLDAVMKISNKQDLLQIRDELHDAIKADDIVNEKNNDSYKVIEKVFSKNLKAY